jgi:hypothetical protein
MHFRLSEVRMQTSLRMLTGCVLICLATNAVVAHAQESPSAQPKLSTLQGTVVSTARASVIVKTTDGIFQLFVLDRNTVRPQTIPVQAQVKVMFEPTNDPSTPPIAEALQITAAPPPKVAALTGEVPAPTTVEDEPVPASVRQLERSIQRQTRRYRLGVRGASALDPELFMFGAHTQLGPFFNENVFARPNLEIGFGELTTLVALNFEGVYRLPVVARTSRWNIYAGGGPALNFSHRNFVEETDRGKIDFGDLDLDVGFNFLIGIQQREGMFLELKSSAYSLPTIRFIVGYNF